MDADRVRSYLQVACAGLGFDIGEVWWMSNESGTSTVAAIKEANGHESDSSGEGTFADLTNARTVASQKGKGSRKRTPKKRFLQLYTSKAYCNQRSKLVQPHDVPSSPAANNNNSNGSNQGSPTSPSKQLATLRRTSSAASLELDQEHVLSPRIVEAVTHSTQVVWANCQKTEGLLGRSDIKLQTAIGMPVGVDESGNVWVVVMFSPKNVESSTDAIDYLQYISRSAASTSIPCLLPVVGEADPPPKFGSGADAAGGGTKMICNGGDEEMKSSGNDDRHKNLHHSHSLVSIKASKQPDHTQELGDGVMAKFVSFNLKDDDEPSGTKSPGGTTHYNNGSDLRNAPKDDWGIPMLPEETAVTTAPANGAATNGGGQIDAIDSAITDAFDEASYGVWSTIMNSAGGESRSSIALKMHSIRERLEEFAHAFLGMSVFDVADAWTVSSSSNVSHNSSARSKNGGVYSSYSEGEAVLKCLFTVAATGTNPGINALREASRSASVRAGDGAVGKAYSSGYPVWSSVKELIYDSTRRSALRNCKIETVFSVPIFSSGDVTPSCVLSCYSLLPAESVPFVLNFVQKAVRLLWSGLDRVVNPHESVGRELWKDVSPADLGEMAADVEMQRSFMGKKRPRSLSNALAANREEGERRARYGSIDYSPANAEAASNANKDTRKNNNNNNNADYITNNRNRNEDPAEAGRFSFQEEEYAETDSRDREDSMVMQMDALPSLAPASAPQPATRSAEMDRRDRNDSAVVMQVNFLPSLANASADASATTMTTTTTSPATTEDRITPPYLTFNNGVPINAPPAKGMTPAPLLPNTVQEPSANARFVFLDAGQHDGHWAVQQAVQSVGDVHLWNGAAENGVNVNGQYQNSQNYGAPHYQQQEENLRLPSAPLHQQQQPPPQQPHQPQFRLSYVNYQPANVQQLRPPLNVNVAYPPTGVHTDDPATIRANLMEFNALAQMHTVNGSGQPLQAAPSPATNMMATESLARNNINAANGVNGANALNGTNHATPDYHPPPSRAENGGIDPDRMVVIPISQAEGSVILTGDRGMMYCSPAGTGEEMGRGMPLAMGADHGLFALEDRKPCRIEGCDGLAVLKRPYCARHCGNRQCEREGCTKCAQGATRFCIAHGGGRRCTFLGCDKGARDKYFCAAHGGGKRCKQDGCGKSAVGGSNFCTGHGGGKRCQVPGCDKSAQSSTRFCVKHGGGKKCQHDGCEKVARGRTLYCAAHGGGVRCKLEGCNRVAIGKAQLCRAHGGGANSHFGGAAI